MHSVYSTISVRCCSVPIQCHLDVVSHAALNLFQMVLRFKTNLAPFLEQELEDAELENLLLTLPQFNKDLAFTISRQREPRGCLIHEVA